MRAGILTFHSANNFGAVLQAYALQKALFKINAESEFVEFDINDKGEDSKNPTNPFIKKLIMEGEKRGKLFDEFRKANLKISKAHKANSAQSLNDEYDIFISGSDQIWNFTVAETDERYFLPFAKETKRFSYAASFGNGAVPEIKKDFVTKQLSMFSEISVRENSGAEIVKELTGRDAHVNVDPTFLLSKDEWNEIANDIDGDYVFVYLINYDAKLYEAAKAYAKENGLEVKAITGAFIPQVGFDAFSKYGVGDFVGLIKNAKKVFTNSFHGTAISTIYEKDLSVAFLEGENADRNVRLSNLINNKDQIKEMIIESYEYLKEICRQ